MTQKSFLKLISILFLAVAVIHLFRIYLNFEIKIGDFNYPIWFSWIEMIIALYLGYLGFKFGKN